MEVYLDHNVARDLVVYLRLAGISARCAQDVKMERAGDEAHLFLAAQRGWTLVTHNAKHFRLLHDAWRQWSVGWGVTAIHPGILILGAPISPTGAAREIRELLLSGVDLTNQLFTLRRQDGWQRAD